MHNSPFFSIIIPVYNAKPYIARCLESCINQTFFDIEIIVVDDCGSDESIEIVEEYTKKDKRIKILHNKENLGTFHARVCGERYANGFYILHIDSDDFIKSVACEEFYKTIQSDYNTTGIYADFCCFKVEFLPKGIFKKTPLYIRDILYQKEILENFLIKASSPPVVIWNKVYKRDLLRKIDDFIRFNFQNLSKIIMGEDLLKFFFIVIFSHKSIGLNKDLYVYCDNENSVTRNINSEARDKRVADLKYILTLFDNCTRLDLLQEKHILSAIKKIKNILRSSIELEYRYDTFYFSYLKACIKSLFFYRKWKTYVRILVYFLSFGKIKL
ncbi:glycosyltransferase family 2 protein [Helicobacter anseris]|uniref:glycosyltransferase family 2 protein n=1 Tax=Helicobacter anseris TaxID=375926 RepID=UPI00147625F0|nr:glycosyltransferase family 2 protein [Helicobacter anseris]